MSALTSAPVPDVAPDDHVRGDGPPLVVYLDLACPHCAASWEQLGELGVTLVARHFPVGAKHPRAAPLAAAAEAAALQEGDRGFFDLVDAIYTDPARVDDPHLWERARALGLDLERFEADRRSDSVARRVRGQFESGIRAGVTGTPAFFANGRRIGERDVHSLAL